MLVLSLTAGTTTASTAIGLTSELLTNNALSLTNNTVFVKMPGIYEIQGAAIISATNSTCGLSLYINDESYGNTPEFTAGETATTTTIPLYWVVEVKATNTTDYVELTVLPVGTPTIIEGTISIKKIS